ncbi:MAG: VOC family protein [Candidatus Obscuribacterales bacterium]|nr:VOC family protein [Candidatus Obscuribacterales bacterium]
MQKITPCLWYDDKAEEAVKFYTSLFKNSKIGGRTHYSEAGAKASGRPAGSLMTLMFELDGFECMAMNAGPMFQFTPAISFTVNCQTEEEIETLYKKFAEGGKVLMELAEYPFCEKFAWVEDKFGLSWQLGLTKRGQKIAPTLMFVGEHHKQAEQAMKFYVSQFANSKVIGLKHYEAGEHEPEGTLKHATFSLSGQEFMVLDSGYDHQFNFSLAISFIVNCEDQAEIDKFWTELSAGGNTNHCGWLMDKFGVSWQIVPKVFSQMMLGENKKKADQAIAALYKMTKLDIAELQKAYDQ